MIRVVTLLPAATEIVASLGAGGTLVGVSHECDYPTWVTRLPQVTATRIDPGTPSGKIDQLVRELRAAGRPVIGVDAAQLRALRPDLIVTQGLCDVCAVTDGEVHRLADVLDPTPRILSLTAHDVSGVWTDIFAVGTALELEDEAEEVVLGLTNRLRRITGGSRAQTSRAVAVPRVACIEWTDPPYLAGHWVPELVRAAGGEDVGAEPGSRSVPTSWSEVAERRPTVIIVMLCGFGVERAQQELARVADPVALRILHGVPTWVLDGNAYTSRPGPRIVDGAERIHAALQGREMDGLVRWMEP